MRPLVTMMLLALLVGCSDSTDAAEWRAALDTPARQAAPTQPQEPGSTVDPDSVVGSDQVVESDPVETPDSEGWELPDLWGGRTVLDQIALEEGVQSVLTRPAPEGFGLTATGVSCPNDIVVEAGNTALCAVTIAGTPQQVKISVLDAEGRYEVGFPTDPDPESASTGGTPDTGGWTTSTFDRPALERGVRRILIDVAPDGFGLAEVEDVTCPDDIEVVAGTDFTCTLTVNGQDRTVRITVLDDSGRYEVGFPQ